MDQKKKGNSTVLHLLNYAMVKLNSYKKEILHTSRDNKEAIRAIYGLIIILSANLIKISEATIANSLREDAASAKNDLLAIREQFNALIDKMIQQYEVAKNENKAI